MDSVNKRTCSVEWLFANFVIAVLVWFQLGLEPHHSVCILGFNAPEWNISAMGAIMAW